ncbi:hypothetical protein K9M42_01580 [Patescibacteria group bacterium]|nr:hypothetical protein [Patescibacteria group bacterium]
MKSDLKKVKKVAKEIKEIKIQGATNIARASFSVLKKEFSTQNFTKISEVRKHFKKASTLLKNARPTEPLLFNGIRYVESKINIFDKKNTDELVSEILKSLDYYLDLLDRSLENLKSYGQAFIKNGDNIIVHCHSSSVIGVLKNAHDFGIDFSVYNSETRPLYQGRKTAKDLLEIGIETTLFPDSSSAFLINDISGKDLTMNKMIIGVDAIKLNGDIINKVGSFGMALSSYYSDVPVYIAASLLKIDVLDNIKIEQRDSKEIWMNAPVNLKILNFAFDVVPSKFIKGIICEFGIIKPKEVKKYLKKYYNFLLLD